MSGTAQQTQLHKGNLTLGDYLTHRCTMRTLQQSHAVWIVDDVLGLRYRARLKLCLRPSRYLVLTDDCGGADAAPAGDIDATLAASTAASLVIPLTPECRFDVCASAMNRDEGGLRITLPSSLPTDVEDDGNEMDGAAASYFVLPISNTLGTSSAAVATAWAAVLRSLCQSPVATVAATPAAVPPTASRHADPRAVVDAAARSTASAARTDVKEAAPKHDSNITTLRSTGPAAAVPAPALRTITATAPVSDATPRSAGATSQSRSTPTTTATAPPPPVRQRGLRQNHPPPQLRSTAIPNPHHRTTTTTTTTAITESHHSPSPTRAEGRRARQFDEPPPLHPALSAVHCSPPSPTSPSPPEAAATGNASGKERQRFSSLTTALRDRTHLAAQLAEHLRNSLSPGRNSPSQPAQATAEVAAPSPELDPERPPTMAHISSGLVPALKGFHRRPSVGSDDEDEEGEDGTSSNEGHHGFLAGAGVVDGASGGLTGSHRAGHGTRSHATPVDSPRPQAPRGGHVCNLGSLGPSCGDEEALRIYNEIHGSHSSGSSRPSAVSSSDDGNASSFPSSAYGEEGEDETNPYDGAGRTGPAPHVHTL